MITNELKNLPFTFQKEHSEKCWCGCGREIKETINYNLHCDFISDIDYNGNEERKYKLYYLSTSFKTYRIGEYISNENLQELADELLKLINK